jgi:glycosyltransferase involved in cell wall biosynthesis
LSLENFKVSIVIPTFNRAHFLKQVIDSCLNQTYPCEIIVCDHGSSDNTTEIIKNYRNRLKYIRKEEDFGPHFCWLDGVLHASGDYVHLQFDDDWIKETYIEKCVKLFNDDTGFVFCPAEVINHDDGKIIFTLFNDLFKTGTYKVKKIENFIIENLISPAAIILRKKDMIDALYQGDLPFVKHAYHGVGPDYFMSLICLLRYKKFGYVSEPLAVFRSHDQSITIDASKDVEKQLKIDRAYNEVKEYYLILKYSRIFQIINIMKFFSIRRCNLFLNRAYRLFKLFKSRIFK